MINKMLKDKLYKCIFVCAPLALTPKNHSSPQFLHIKVCSLVSFSLLIVTWQFHIASLAVHSHHLWPFPTSTPTTMLVTAVLLPLLQTYLHSFGASHPSPPLTPSAPRCSPLAQDLFLIPASSSTSLSINCKGK